MTRRGDGLPTPTHCLVFDMGVGDWFAPARIEVQDLLHGHAGVCSHRQKLPVGGFYPLELGDAEKVPGWVFDVIGIHCPVPLELFSAIAETFGVLQRQPALPQLRFRLRHGHDELIEDPS